MPDFSPSRMITEFVHIQDKEKKEHKWKTNKEAKQTFYKLIGSDQIAFAEFLASEEC